MSSRYDFAMRVRIALTGPPRVILGREVVDVLLPHDVCTLEELLNALADAEPRIASYLRSEGGLPPAPFRPLLHDQTLDPETAIPDGALVTLLYAIAGG